MKKIKIIYFYYLFFHRRPIQKLCFLSCRPFVVNATFSTGIADSFVSWFWQLIVGVFQLLGFEISLLFGLGC